jgi:N6-adenosine-specific RNA methylase IME4
VSGIDSDVLPGWPSGRFSTIVADPPWKYDFSATSNREIENHYQTMTTDDICALPVPVADDAVLYLWATAPKLEDALRVLKAWGFRYKTHAVWDKEIIGMGYWFRGQHELLLVGTRGKMKAPAQELRVASVIRERRTVHSRKPELVQDMIERWFPGPRLELFARRKRPNWTCWGNEVVAGSSIELTSEQMEVQAVSSNTSREASGCQ